MYISILLASLVMASGMPAAFAPDVAEPETSVYEEILVGIMAPSTGGAAGYGQDIMAASMFAVSDFNAKLVETGAKWQLVPVYMDSMTSRGTIIPGLEYFDSLDIKVVAGPSIDIIGPDVPVFASKNDMLLVSCCSVTLVNAIAGDNMYRMTPNQTNHGIILSKVMLQSGIDAMIPIGRNASWITDIIYPASEAFRKAGGQVVEPILYDSPEKFGTPQLLEISGIIEAYESRGMSVAILYVGFEETFDIIEAASSHETLKSVQWFGADANTILHTHSLDDAASVGFTSVQPIIRTDKEGVLLTERLMQHLDRMPSVYAYQQYDAVLLIGEAIRQSGGYRHRRTKTVYGFVVLYGYRRAHHVRYIRRPARYRIRHMGSQRRPMGHNGRVECRQYPDGLFWYN